MSNFFLIDGKVLRKYPPKEQAVKSGGFLWIMVEPDGKQTIRTIGTAFYGSYEMRGASLNVAGTYHLDKMTRTIELFQE